MNWDMITHGAEVIAIVFWIGVSYGDLKWLKETVRELKDDMKTLVYRPRV